jgi:hypothetical protein
MFAPVRRFKQHARGGAASKGTDGEKIRAGLRRLLPRGMAGQRTTGRQSIWPGKGAW